MDHIIISDEINAGIPAYVQPVYTLKDSSWVSLNVITFQQIYSISSIEKHVIRCTYLICPFKRGHNQFSSNNVLKCLLESYFLAS